MSIRNNAVLTFNSDLGRTVRLTIPRAEMNLTATRPKKQWKR